MSHVLTLNGGEKSAQSASTFGVTGQNRAWRSRSIKGRLHIITVCHIISKSEKVRIKML
jgi:hypothetical protein